MIDSVTLRILAAVAISIVALATDIREKKIPNWLTAPGALLGLVTLTGWGAWTGGLSGAGEWAGYSLLGFLCGFGLLFVLFLIGGGGGGDVKFMGALGAWLGWKMIFEIYVLSAFLLAVYAIASLIGRFIVGGVNVPAASSVKEMITSRRKRGVVPFAIPAALATWLALLRWTILDRWST